MVNMSLGKALVIAPHADDETFGCGGTIYKLAEAGSEVHVVIMADDSKILDKNNIRIGEFGNVAELLGIKRWEVLFPGRDGYLDELPIRLIVSKLDKVLDTHKYDYVFLPYPSHHQDHKVTFDASMAALRPGARNHIPRAILAYEYTYPNWQEFKHEGKLFVDIGGEPISRKMNAIKDYKSQLQHFPHPVSPSSYLTLAAARGLAIGVAYAEMFYIIQMRGIPVWL